MSASTSFWCLKDVNLADVIATRPEKMCQFRTRTTCSERMNRRIVITLLVVFVPVIYVFYVASSLIALLLEDGLTDAVSLENIGQHGSQNDVLHPIPKIIHQTWKNNDIPEQWQIAQFTW